MWGVTLVHNKATMGNPDTTIFNIRNKRDTWDTKPNTTKPDVSNMSTKSTRTKVEFIGRPLKQLECVKKNNQPSRQICLEIILFHHHDKC